MFMWILTICSSVLFYVDVGWMCLVNVVLCLMELSSLPPNYPTLSLRRDVQLGRFGGIDVAVIFFLALDRCCVVCASVC